MDREMVIIVSICSLIVLLPVFGYIIYLIIKSRRDYQLVENLPVGVKSWLSAPEAAVPLEEKSYREYRNGLIHGLKTDILFSTFIVVVVFILSLMKYHDDMGSIIKAMIVIYLLLIGTFAATAIFKIFKLGDNVGIVKMRCVPVKYHDGYRNTWLLIAFYDRDIMQFRKKRLYSGFNRFFVKDGNYILARHGIKKMRIIGLYQEEITTDSVSKGWDYLS